MEELKIKKEDAQKIAEYLSLRPYREVVQVQAQVQIAIQTVVITIQ